MGFSLWIEYTQYMTLVESRTALGDAHQYDEFEDVVVYSPYGVLTFDEIGGVCTGELQPFQAEKINCVDPSVVHNQVEFEVYAVMESLFVPLGQRNTAKHGSVYVINGEQVVKVGSTRQLRPDIVGGAESDEKVVELYTNAFPAPHNVEDSMEAELIGFNELVQLFEEQEIEEVLPIK